MRKLLIIIIFALFASIPLYGGESIWQKAKRAPTAFLYWVTHPRVVAVLDYMASAMHVYYDASTDAVFWQIQANRNKSITEINDMMHGGSNFHNIHYYKNMSRLALALKGYCIGVSIVHIKEKKMTWKRLILRQVGMIPGMMGLWQLRYKHCRYGKAWDCSAEHNETRYVIPLPNQDIKIALQGWQVSAATGLELSTSAAFFLWDLTTELAPRPQSASRK